MGIPPSQYSLLENAKPPRSGAISPNLRCSQERVTEQKINRKRYYKIRYIILPKSIKYRTYVEKMALICYDYNTYTLFKKEGE